MKGMSNLEFKSKLVGIRIMQKRKEKGLNQEELSKLIGISKNHLSSLERGKYLPTTYCISKICSALGGTPDYYLIGRISLDDENEFLSLIEQCPPVQLNIIKKLIKLYLDEIDKI